MNCLPNPNIIPTTEKQYAYIYNMTTCVVNSNEDIPFDSNGVLTDCFIHNYGSPVIIIKKTALYKIIYTIITDSSNNQFTLAVNNHSTYNTLYGSDAGLQNYGQTIMSLREGDILTVRNVSMPIILTEMTHDSFNIVNASLIIEELQ
jgi:hypothetical protein